MRPARVFRMILRIFVLVLTISMSLISFLGGLSAVKILSNPDNIKLPNGNIQANFDIQHPNSIYIKVPFKITNEGYFDLEDLYIKITIAAVDGHGDEVEIFQKSTNFGDIPKGESLSDVYSGDYKDFIISNIYEAYLQLDYSSGITLKADIVLGAKYELGLLSLRVELYNIPVGSL